MKKYLILLILPVILLGAGCKQNGDAAKKDYFEKKQACTSYKKEIEEQYSVATEGVFSNVIKIFYSPVRNSCLFVTYESYPGLYSGFFIYDYMTKEQLFKYSDRNQLDKKVVELESDL